MHKVLKCIVIDDEPIGREIIKDLIRQVPDIELLNSFADPMEAFVYLQKNQVDIVFSDIEMPNLDGVSLLRSLSDPPLFIFITAHRDFALDGFETGATDYLMKPVRFERFMKAVNRARDHFNNSKILFETKVADTIFIKVGGKLVKIILDEILYVEAQNDYLKIVTTTETYQTLATLKSIEGLLIPPAFFRVQRSFIVRLSAIKVIDGNKIEIIGGKSIPLALGKRGELYEILGIK
ncbi:LytR/AlgR family response regulator transcription factor [Chryseobacterium taklimakanense]|uniref:DNA-binding response regulator n=1 Tax=Chryseobacterium taklimakanense TaxID=536441 RepID=A0A3G8WKA2_9FLAO|nr:LytTR family DNA-binding domain-containing protein [Chryseobacterium taklimakanense]AZI20648.1 DNA-binding response regulator [Chryseobacterium taklimakanense]